MKQLNIWVDERPSLMHFGYTIMQSCAILGIDIPRFCYHDKLMIAGNCRVCLVEVRGSKKLVASCAVHIAEKIEIYTNTIRVRLARQNVLEFLLANHPLDCPICDQGGECDLQDLTISFGADRGRFYEFEKRSVLNKDFGPLIRTSMNRCIHCTRCVRFLSYVSGSYALGTLGRGYTTEIGTYVSRFLDDPLSGNITDLCPVGALTSKPYSFRVRPWELTSVKTLDVLDSLNSTILVDVSVNKIFRVLPYLNEKLNEDWITNKARYSYDGVFFQRIYSCLVKVKFLDMFMFNSESLFSTEFFVKVSWKAAVCLFVGRIFSLKTKIVYSVLGGLTDLETAVSARFFFNSLGLTNTCFSSQNFFSFNADFPSLFLFNMTLSSVSKVPSFCFFLKANPRFESPLLNLRLVKLFSNFKVPFYSVGLNGGYTNLKVSVISRNVWGFIRVCEFSHSFCRNFYLDLFLAQPLFVVGGGLLARHDAFLFTTALVNLSRRLFGLSGGLGFFLSVSSPIFENWGFLSYFGFLHSYSSRVQALDVGFVAGVLDFNETLFRTVSDPIIVDDLLFYSIGCNELFLVQLAEMGLDFKSWLVYQGSHGVGLAVFANLILPVSTFFERSGTFKNLMGLSQRAALTVNSYCPVRADFEVFEFVLETSLRLLREKFFGLRFYNAVVYHAHLTQYDKHYSSSLVSQMNVVVGLGFLGNISLRDFFWKWYSYVIVYCDFGVFRSDLLSKFVLPVAFYGWITGRAFKLGNFNFLYSNYYGDTVNEIVASSKVMSLSSAFFLRKSFSFFF